MTIRSGVIAAGLALTAPCAGASAQDAARACRDDKGVDRCAEDGQARMRALYGADSLETLAGGKIAVRRAFFVDGYGRDIGLVSFLRPPGADPAIEVRFPAERRTEALPTLAAPLSEQQWRDALRETALFERRLVPLEDASPSICLHGWVATVEANDPPFLPQNQFPTREVRGVSRRKTDSACGNDGLAMRAAMRLATLALDSIPACGTLDRNRHRSEVHALGACARLRGDRFAAAAAHNALAPLSGGTRAFEQVAALFVSLPIGADRGEAVKRRNEDAALLAGSRLYLDHVEGLDPDRATATGVLEPLERGAGEPVKRRVRLDLTRELGNFRVARIEAIPEPNAARR